MRRALFIAIALAVLGVGCGGDSPRPTGTSPDTSMAGFDTFTDSANGFTIKYPPDWEKQEDVQGAAVVFLSPREGGGDRFRENINVLIQSLPDPDMTLQEYSDLSTEQAPQLIQGFKVLDEETTSVGGHEAQRVHYSGSISGNDLEWQAVWLVEGGKAYVITFTADPDTFSDYLAQAEASLNSFRLT